MIISGFPGVGKSTFCQMLQARQGTKRTTVHDSDSSTFDKTAFPANYLDHIKKAAPVYDYVLVSSHQAVREGMMRMNLPFLLVYPSIDQKSEYWMRYAERGSPQAFMDLMDREWDNFIQSCEETADLFVRHIVLKPGQYLSDLIGVAL